MGGGGGGGGGFFLGGGGGGGGGGGVGTLLDNAHSNSLLISNIENIRL